MESLIELIYQIMDSINANHQILDPNYVTGLADGEGSFCVSISPRQTMITGWEIRPSFSLSQNFRSRKILYFLKDYFGCGSVRESKSDQTWKYEVRSLEDLIKRVIPHFKNYPLQTAKFSDFERFNVIVAIMEKQGHLSREGIQEILVQAKQMNPSGKRKYSNLMK